MDESHEKEHDISITTQHGILRDDNGRPYALEIIERHATTDGRVEHYADVLPTALPITLHASLEMDFEGWAEALGWHPAGLVEATERAIRNRHREATLEDGDSNMIRRYPIFRLGLDSIDVFYTIEQGIVIVRGYGWEIDGVPCDDFDGGGFYI